MNNNDTTLSPAQESILKEYFEHDAAEHAEICRDLEAFG